MVTWWLVVRGIPILNTPKASELNLFLGSRKQCAICGLTKASSNMSDTMIFRQGQLCNQLLDSWSVVCCRAGIIQDSCFDLSMHSVDIGHNKYHGLYLLSTGCYTCSVSCLILVKENCQVYCHIFLPPRISAVSTYIDCFSLLDSFLLPRYRNERSRANLESSWNHRKV